MKPAIGLITAAALLAWSAYAALAVAGHQPDPHPSIAAFLAGIGLGLFAATLLLCTLHCINRLIEWRADISIRRHRTQPTNHR